MFGPDRTAYKDNQGGRKVKRTIIGLMIGLIIGMVLVGVSAPIKIGITKIVAVSYTHLTLPTICSV